MLDPLQRRNGLTRLVSRNRKRRTVHLRADQCNTFA